MTKQAIADDMTATAHDLLTNLTDQELSLALQVAHKDANAAGESSWDDARKIVASVAFAQLAQEKMRRKG